jgi:hypothetical protein
MAFDENENRASEIDPTGLWRLAFWLAFVLGNLSLLFSWLLAQVPRPIHGADLHLDYAVRSCSALFFLISILMARWIWKIDSLVPEQSPVRAIHIVVLVAWIGVVIAILGTMEMAVFRH